MKFLIFALVVSIGLVGVQSQECKCDTEEIKAFKEAKKCVNEKLDKAALEDEPTFNIQIVPGEHKINDTGRPDEATNKRERRAPDPKTLRDCADTHLGKIDCYQQIKSDCKDEDECMHEKIKEAVKKCQDKRKNNKNEPDE